VHEADLEFGLDLLSGTFFLVRRKRKKLAVKNDEVVDAVCVLCGIDFRFYSTLGEQIDQSGAVLG